MKDHVHGYTLNNNENQISKYNFGLDIFFLSLDDKHDTFFLMKQHTCPNEHYETESS